MTTMKNAALAVLLLAASAGCAHQVFKPGQQVTVKGELTAGAECNMIVTKEGRRYSVTGDPGRFKIGDRVCIMGRVAEASICMAGDATISIRAIGPEEECP